MLVVAVLIRLDARNLRCSSTRDRDASLKCRGRDIEAMDGLSAPSPEVTIQTLLLRNGYFQLVKFRTMFADARTRFPEVLCL